MSNSVIIIKLLVYVTKFQVSAHYYVCVWARFHQTDVPTNNNNLFFLLLFYVISSFHSVIYKCFFLARSLFFFFTFFILSSSIRSLFTNELLNSVLNKMLYHSMLFSKKLNIFFKLNISTLHVKIQNYVDKT